MLYVCYRHRHDPAREIVMHDGAAFPAHLRQKDWYLHGTHSSVIGGRTEADIATRGYCERKGGVTFGRKVVARHRPEVDRGTTMRPESTGASTTPRAQPHPVEGWG